MIRIGVTIWLPLFVVNNFYLVISNLFVYLHHINQTENKMKINYENLTGMPQHIFEAIEQAKLEGHKGVMGFVGGFDEHHKTEKLIREGKKVIFQQKTKYGTFVQLLRNKTKREKNLLLTN